MDCRKCGAKHLRKRKSCGFYFCKRCGVQPSGLNADRGGIFSLAVMPYWQIERNIVLEDIGIQIYTMMDIQKMPLKNVCENLGMSEYLVKKHRVQYCLDNNIDPSPPRKIELKKKIENAARRISLESGGYESLNQVQTEDSSCKPSEDFDPEKEFALKVKPSSASDSASTINGIRKVAKWNATH